MRFALSAAAVALTVLSLPVLAHATPMVQFEITGVDIFANPEVPLVETFTLVQAPTDIGNISDYGFGYSDPFAVDRNGVQTIADGAFFYSALASGGATLVEGQRFGYDFGGDQFYSGPPSAPVFLPGTYAIYGGGADKLVITEVGMTSAPEPASLALMGTGALAACGVVRRRIAG